MGVLLNSARFPYFHHVLKNRLLHQPSDLAVLDVGCGGGSLSMLFAQAGYRVTGVDPDPSAIDAGRMQAEQLEREASFRIAAAENLPFPAAHFDVVVVSEVLEHVGDLSRALDEIIRVLKFGGVLLFSTPNRSLLTYLLLIKFAQDWKPTAVITEVEHRYAHLVRPAELRRDLATRGVDVYEVQGVGSPLGALPGAALAYLKYKIGSTPLSQLAEALQLKVSGSTRLAYIGWGIKES